MTEESNKDVISALNGTALRVFVYALKQGKDVGVRETQRSIGLKSASHAQYHLQRLEQLGLLVKTKNNRYNLAMEYENLRSLKLGILTEIYVFKGWLFPSLSIFSGYLFMSTIMTIIFYFIIDPLIALIYGSFALFSSATFTFIRSLQIIRNFKRDTE
ncbi:MAG: hypothetical protein ACTSQE_10705 [Candidatus Heimdallarchaeaceae archaeon]